MKTRVRRQFGFRCFNCGAGPKRLHLDHHRPLVKGHALVYGNCASLCRACNLSKGALDPEEFYTASQLRALNGLLREQRGWPS